MDALLYFKESKEISIVEYVKRYNITDRTARRDMSDLINKGLILKTGNKKTAKYLLQ